MKALYTYTALLSVIPIPAFTQDSTSNYSWSGYIEAYYSYDFNAPVDGRRSKDPIFTRDSELIRHDTFITTSLTIGF